MTKKFTHTTHCTDDHCAHTELTTELLNNPTYCIECGAEAFSYEVGYVPIFKLSEEHKRLRILILEDLLNRSKPLQKEE